MDKEKILQEYVDETHELLTNGQLDIDMEATKKWLEVVLQYSTHKKGLTQKLHICSSPKDLQRKAKEVGVLYGKDINLTSLDGVGLCYDAGWTMYVLAKKKCNESISVFKEFQQWSNLVKTGVWDCALFDENIFLCKKPTKVFFNDKKQLHNVSGKAIEWEDGYGLYFYNNMLLPPKYIEQKDQITKQDIKDQTNSELSRALAEILGWDKYLQMADVKLVDKLELATKNVDGEVEMIHYELYEMKNQFDNAPRLLKMESPMIKDGTRPWYIEPVPKELKTCAAARKAKFAKGIDENGEPIWPTIEECNADPELTFEAES